MNVIINRNSIPFIERDIEILNKIRIAFEGMNYSEAERLLKQWDEELRLFKTDQVEKSDKKEVSIKILV